MPAKKESILGPLMFGKAGKMEGEMTPAQQQCFYKISKDPWSFMRGIDPISKEPICWTRHEYSERGEDPFPDKPYIPILIKHMIEDEVVLVPKSRQMIVTTTALVLSLWEILFRPSQRIILSKVTEDEACELLENKVRYTYGRMPEWIRRIRPLPDKPRDKAKCPVTNSYILAAAENTANRECRGGTATRLIVDEACYQDKLQEILEAGQPMTQRVVIVSTPNASYPGGRYMKALVNDEEIGVA